MSDSIRIIQPHSIAKTTIPAERTPLGRTRDYKPCIASLPDGELIVVAFRWTDYPQDKLAEELILFRSKDGGRTWCEIDGLDIPGREFYANVFSDGIILLTAHFLPQDVRNDIGYTVNLLLRSVDGGKSWERRMITKEHVPGADPQKPSINTSRNILELHDGTLLYGVSAAYGHDYLWRSSDRGKTWDRSQRCTFAGVEPHRLWSPFWAEAVLWQAPNNDIIAFMRVDQKIFPPIPGTTVPQEEADHYERVIAFRSRDRGATWEPEPETGFFYGEMYPSILRLGGHRLLLTFTVRSVVPPRVAPLGVHAVLGKETPAGFSFDFTHDRIVLDEKTPAGQASGGGFGPTVQLDDGTLLTSYSYSGPGPWPNDIRMETVRWRLP